MAHQIDKLASNLGLINQLLKWLLFRCKGTKHEAAFNAAIALFRPRATWPLPSSA